MSRRRIESSVRTLALQLASEGVKVKHIAQTVKVSVPTVYNWLRAEKGLVSIYGPASAEPEAAL